MLNIGNKEEINELRKHSEIWHYRETAKRTGKTIGFVRKVLIYKTRFNKMVTEEFARVVEESNRRKKEIIQQFNKFEIENN